MKTDISLAKLRQDLYKALKSWHDASDDNSPLRDLELYRRVLLNENCNARKATNKILFDALEALNLEYPEGADLLRKHYLDGRLMYAIANQHNIGEATAYRKQHEAVDRLAGIILERERQIRQARQAVLEKRLEPLTYDHLVGVEHHLDGLLDLLTTPESPWIIAIEGLGGLGKTSLADALSRRVIQEGLLPDFGWVSARQQNFNPGGAIKTIDQPALTVEDLVSRLADQLLTDLPHLIALSFQDALRALQHKLKAFYHLIVIDNLETLSDLESLLPTLRLLANPTKFLLTTRESLNYEPDLYHFPLPELSEAHVYELVRHQARQHNLPHLAEADEATLHQIYAIAGGNPLTLRLIVGQAHVHPLDAILSDLAAARGQNAAGLYTYIYGRAWDSLDEPTRQVFLAMPLATDQGGDLVYLTTLVGFEPSVVRSALERLTTLNLIDSRGDLHERRYTIHNLTRSFLREQVAKW